MVLNLVLIGLAVALEPLPLTAFLIVLLLGLWLIGDSIYLIVSRGRHSEYTRG